MAEVYYPFSTFWVDKNKDTNAIYYIGKFDTDNLEYDDYCYPPDVISYRNLDVVEEYDFYLDPEMGEEEHPVYKRFFCNNIYEARRIIIGNHFKNNRR